MSDSPELLKPDTEVTDRGLQIELGNLNAENEALRQEHDRTKQQYLELLETSANKIKEVEADRAKLLESSTHIINKLRQDVQELRSQLETERADREEVEAELSDLKQNSVTASKELPDAATILNQLRGKRKKTPVTPADIEVILGIIEKS